MARDIVCDKVVDENQAVARRLMKNYGGKTYYFCSRDCMEEFERDPERYGRKPGFYTGHDAVVNEPRKQA